MNPITESEQLTSAKLLVQMLENRVSQIERERRADLAQYVEIESKNQAYWYATDSGGYIAIQQDAAFVCTGIHVCILDLSASDLIQNAARLLISIEDLWPPRQATQSAALPISNTTLTNVMTAQSISVPLDHFLQAYAGNDASALNPANVDYWYTPVAAWLIERGDTIRCLFQGDSGVVSGVATNFPVVVLSGYKVLG